MERSFSCVTPNIKKRSDIFTAVLLLILPFYSSGLGVIPGAVWKKEKPDAVMEQVRGTDPGVPCHFPFLYNGVLYWGCTEIDSSGFPWCSTTFNYDVDQLHGYCRPKNCVTGSKLAAYGGDKRTTKDGLPCTDWRNAPSANTIEYHIFDSGYTMADVADRCRNPDADAVLGPNCYTGGTLRSCDVPVCDECGENLISKSGSTISSTSDITASSVAADTSAETHSTSYSVLGTAASGNQVGGWCTDRNDTDQWIQVDLKQTHKVVGVAVQGRHDADEWVTHFQVNYSLDAVSWETVEENGTVKVFAGSADQIAAYFLPAQVYTRYLRILPEDWHGRICLRFDVAGCKDIDDCASNPCQHGGTCVDLTDYYECRCTADWTGSQCQLDYDECLSDPCINGGTCVNLANSFNCSCGGGYYGLKCELGYEEDCEAVGRAGLNETGHYSIWLFKDESPCIMVEELQGAATESAWIEYSITDEKQCVETCLNITECLSVTFASDTGKCKLYDFPATTREAKAVHYNKQCPGIQQIFCNMSDPLRPVTHISHNRPGTTLIEGVYPSYAHRTSINYWPVTDLQIEKLKAGSISCMQTLIWECKQSDSFYQAIILGDLKRYGMSDYIYGSCRCLLQDSCATDRYGRCNCRGETELKTDSGTFTNKSRLPVRAIFGGDTGSYGRHNKYQLGELLCTQAITDINECDSSPCMNGANCTDLRYSYECTCQPGFAGDHCQDDIDDCESGPCWNGGSCIDKINYYICTCPPGYTNNNCETDIDECRSNPCQNNASCINEQDRWRCLCWPGYRGIFCEIDTDECESSPCENGGVCSNEIAAFVCACPDGYDQPRCINDTDECYSEPCFNNGTCIDHLSGYSCGCSQGFYGDHCQHELDECDSSPCYEGGTCHDQPGRFSCDCPPGFTGRSCLRNIDDCHGNLCMNGAQCVDAVQNYTCQCTDGYSGVYCQTEVNECDSSPCTNGGHCKDYVARYVCECPAGYTGEQCQIDIDECTSWPCLSGGICVDGENAYSCRCRSGYSGNRCQNERVAGNWGSWESWGNCSVQCGRGVTTRRRMCDNPAPKSNGAPCADPQSEVQPCIAKNCKDLDGRWSTWGPWSGCSRTCGLGSKVRLRQCDSPAPAGSGEDCLGNNSTLSSCKDRECGVAVDGAWSFWGDWTQCTASCGVGTRWRHRTCSDPPPAYGGLDCGEKSTEAAPCLVHSCPDEVTCEEWKGWSACSATCGDGQRMRNRTCTYVTQTETEESIPIGQSWKEFEFEHCQNRPCFDMECFTCSREISSEEADFRCWGPRVVCPDTAPFCSAAFSRGNDSRGHIKKGCSSSDECSIEQSLTCQRLRRQTIDAIITTESEWLHPLQPHEDTVLRLWSGLEVDDLCRICCTRARCNRGILPPGNALYTGGGWEGVTRLNFLSLLMTTGLQLLLLMN